MTTLPRAVLVAQSLEGTCDALEQYATPAECNDGAFLSDVDELVFCCDLCGWWCEASERGEEGDVCLDCERDG